MPGGRPVYIATDENRKQVCLLSACGMSHSDIAKAIGCNHITLRKYYRDELKGGAARKRAEILGMLQTSAEAGSVAAQRHMELITRSPDAAAAADLGKKEIRQAKAEKSASGGRFGVSDVPKLVISNG